MQLIDASRKKYDASCDARRETDTYGYVGGNPLNRIDPTGEAFFLLAIPFIGGTGATVGGGTAVAYGTVAVGALGAGYYYGDDIKNAISPMSSGNGDLIGDIDQDGTGDVIHPDAARDHKQYKDRLDILPPPGMDPCDTVRWKLQRAQRELADRINWDTRWMPGKHAEEIQNVRNRIRKLKKKLKNLGCEENSCD